MLNLSSRVLIAVGRRNIGSTSVLQTDTIQQLFADKIRDYGKKAQATKSGLVDASAQQQSAYDEELSRLNRVHNVSKGEDLTKFPAFNFEDKPLAAPGIEWNLAGGDDTSIPAIEVHFNDMNEFDQEDLLTKEYLATVKTGWQPPPEVPKNKTFYEEACETFGIEPVKPAKK